MKNPEELIVTQSNLFDIIDGLCDVNNGIAAIQDKITEEEGKAIMIPMLATLLEIVKLFPTSKQKEMIELMQKHLDIDLTEIMKMA